MGPSSEALIRIENVCKSRVDQEGRQAAILRGLTLEICAGRLTVVIGPSGGGKSTLVRLINRLDEADSGRILYAGRDITEIDPRELRRRIALVMQKPFLFSGSVLENLQRPFHFRDEPPPAADDAGFLDLLEEIEIPRRWLERDARSLSLGEQQRVCLARSLLCAPDALLLDEPTSALDQPTADRLVGLLRKLHLGRGMAMLMVTHDLRLAERAADYLAYLDDGRIVEQGDAGRLLAHPQSAVLQRFLHQPLRDETSHER
jgi:putative ABC transport system ATP-binding protein